MKYTNPQFWSHVRFSEGRFHIITQCLWWKVCQGESVRVCMEEQFLFGRHPLIHRRSYGLFYIHGFDMETVMYCAEMFWAQKAPV